jgi:hypothetical protein
LSTNPEFKINEQDLKFLKSLRIKIDEEKHEKDRQEKERPGKDKVEEDKHDKDS